MKKAIKKIEKMIKELELDQEHEEKKSSKRYRQYNVANDASTDFQSQVNALKKALATLRSTWGIK